GAEVALDAPAFIESSRTYMPVRFVAEKLGATVGWDSATSTATLTK
ncbi:MAG: copper amine oxidase N-terminal domain-containing protein, partial [Clostridia bacterium]|nr:copper amine oxidase N-terminal domain-containing protein [Clostridia bacterium]